MIRQSRRDVDIRPLHTVEDVFLAVGVFAQVWGGDDGGMPPNMLRALAFSGNYAVGLWDGDTMVGASVAFFAEPDARSMHSHVTGILPAYQRSGYGRVLKQHQREWALARGVGHITWTFDPLVARNAHFNLAVLGGRAVRLLPNHYGPMDDDINRGDETDRLLVSWALAERPLPAPASESVLATVAVPADVERLRVEGGGCARHWRTRVREELGSHLDAGLRIGGFDIARGYLLVAGGEPAGPPGRRQP